MNEIDRIKAVANSTRMKILSALQKQKKPVTIKEIGNLLGIDPTKLHYHFKILDKALLIKVVETKEINGITEKYYLILDDSDITISLQTHKKEALAFLPIYKKSVSEIISRLMSLDGDDETGFGMLKTFSLSKEDALQFKASFMDFMAGKSSQLPNLQTENSDNYDFVVAFVPSKENDVL